MTQKRILFLDQYGDIGGGQTVLLSLVQAASRMPSLVSVLAPGSGRLQESITARFGDTVAFHHCDEPKLSHGGKGLRDAWRLLAYGWHFRHHLKLLRWQHVIYINGPRHLPHMLILSLLTSARIICHVHLDHTGFEKILLRLAARWPRPFHLVANSRFVADGLKLEAHQVTLVENALDESLSALPFRDRFHGNGAAWRSAVIGTMRPEKGQDMAVEAVSDRDDMTLHVIGRDGDGASDWIQRLKSASPRNIVFEGATANLPATLDALNIQFSLVPSRWEEPFGLVAIESMACSCVTIVSGRGGLGEIADRTGALVARDKTELAQALARLCAMPSDALIALARRQFDAAQRNYSPEHFESRIQSLLAAAFAGPIIPV